MKITQIRTFRVPIESNRLDRYVDNVEVKIASKLKETIVKDDKKYAWEFGGTTTGKITINSKTRVNYVAIKSDLFTDDDSFSESYWFLKAVDGLQSSKGITYSAVLDPWATFGKDFLNTFKNKNIEIKRYHQDRYTATELNGVVTLSINPKHTSLFQSDFKIGDTLNQTKTYQSAVQTNRPSSIIHEFFDTDGNTLLGKVDNRVFTDNGVWWKYAIIELSGEPNGVKYGPGNGQGGTTDQIETLQKYVSKDTDRGVGIDAFKMIVPIGRLEGEDNAVLNMNSIQEIDRLPNGKITSIFLSPEWLRPETNGFSYSLLPIGNETDLKGKDSVGVIAEAKKNQEDASAIPVILGFSYPKLPSDNPIELPTWNGKLVETFAGSPAEAKALMKKLDSEIGLLNTNISPLDFMYKGDTDLKLRIDIAEYLKNPKVVFRTLPDGQGAMFDLNIADYHFATLDGKTQLNVVSESGSNYLNNNRSQIVAQKEGFRLQAKLQKNQVSQQQANQYGGGIIGGITSLFNPANWAASAIRGESNQIIDDIADNNIAKVNAAIKDATAAAPSVKEGSGNGWKLATTFEEKGIFTYMLVQPNDVLLQRIYNHYNKFGYKAEQWVIIPNKDNWWETRVKFDFLQIDVVKDYYNGELNIDDGIVDLFAEGLKNGVRLWKQESIEYDNDNIEIAINNL